MPIPKTIYLLKVSAFLIFIGRAWQHLFWDAPYRSIFWDESLMKPFVENVLGRSWQDYATDLSTDHFIQSLIIGNGILYVIAALCCLLLTEKNKKWLQLQIFLGGISLVLLAAMLTKEKFYHIAQFFEHSIQFGVPFVLLYVFSKGPRQQKTVNILKFLIALTFFSHGLYALGFYPVPGKFVDMIISIFGFSESTAVSFLYLAGILDLVLAVVIFVPKVAKYALWYAVFWGLLTALARVIANFYLDFPLQSLNQNLYETIYRLPHGLIPLTVLLYTNSNIFLKKKITGTS